MRLQLQSHACRTGSWSVRWFLKSSSFRIQAPPPVLPPASLLRLCNHSQVSNTAREADAEQTTLTLTFDLQNSGESENILVLLFKWCKCFVYCWKCTRQFFIVVMLITKMLKIIVIISECQYVLVLSCNLFTKPKQNYCTVGRGL